MMSETPPEAAGTPPFSPPPPSFGPSQPGQGCAWDTVTGGGYFAAIVEVVKLALKDPTTLFTQVASGRGMGRPYTFALVMIAVAYVFTFAYQAGFQMLGTLVGAGGADGGLSAMISIPIMLGGIILGAVCFAPIMAAITIFVQAGIYHLCLMIVGGAKEDFETTVRVVGYASAPNIFQIVPLLGPFVAGAWCMVLNIIGLKVAHQTTYGKSVLAVLLPTILCCGLIILAVVAVLGAVVAAGIKP